MICAETDQGLGRRVARAGGGSLDVGEQDRPLPHGGRVPDQGRSAHRARHGRQAAGRSTTRPLDEAVGAKIERQDGPANAADQVPALIGDHAAARGDEGHVGIGSPAGRRGSRSSASRRRSKQSSEQGGGHRCGPRRQARHDGPRRTAGCETGAIRTPRTRRSMGGLGVCVGTPRRDGEVGVRPTGHRDRVTLRAGVADGETGGRDQADATEGILGIFSWGQQEPAGGQLLRDDWPVPPRWRWRSY